MSLPNHCLWYDKLLGPSQRVVTLLLFLKTYIPLSQLHHLHSHEEDERDLHGKERIKPSQVPLQQQQCVGEPE